MSRLKLELPGKLLTSVSIPVRINEINYGNHVGNNSIVEIIHEARVQFLNLHGLSELNSGGIGLIMSELEVEFKSEAFYNDLLEVKIFCGEILPVSFELFYQISVNRNNQSFIIAKAKTGMVSYDYSVKKVRAMPEELRSILLGK